MYTTGRGAFDCWEVAFSMAYNVTWMVFLKFGPGFWRIGEQSVDNDNVSTSWTLGIRVRFSNHKDVLLPTTATSRLRLLPLGGATCCICSRWWRKCLSTSLSLLRIRDCQHRRGDLFSWFGYDPHGCRSFDSCQ